MHTKHIHKGKNLTLTLTFQQTLEAIQERRPCSPASLRRYIRKLSIKPLGTMRTKPHRFDYSTPARILTALGERGSVVTMTQLRAVKRQAKAREA